MKYLRTLFVIAFFTGLIALATAYLHGQRESRHTEQLWQESLQQLKHICRLKHSEYRNYAAHARQAEQDSLHRLATLLHTMSAASEVQYENCRKAINSLGGVFQIPITPDKGYEDSDSLLSHAIQHKLLHHNSTTHNGIEQALKDGNRYVARMLTWCDASEVRQIMILQRELATDTQTVSIYMVCPTCGAVSEESLLPYFCPHCMTSSEEFLVFE